MAGLGLLLSWWRWRAYTADGWRVDSLFSAEWDRLIGPLSTAERPAPPWADVIGIEVVDANGAPLVRLEPGPDGSSVLIHHVGVDVDARDEPARWRTFEVRYR